MEMVLDAFLDNEDDPSPAPPSKAKHTQLHAILPGLFVAWTSSCAHPWLPRMGRDAPIVGYGTYLLSTPCPSSSLHHGARRCRRCWGGFPSLIACEPLLSSSASAATTEKSTHVRMGIAVTAPTSQEPHCSPSGMG